MRKTVLITGAGGGMGQAACRRLLELGWTVFGLDCQAPGSAENLCFIPTDLTDAASVEEACARAHIQVMGGHTEVTKAVTQPIISVTGVGKVLEERLVSTAGAKAGSRTPISSVKYRQS